MSNQNCSCERFDKFEGASVAAYIRAFLDAEESDGEVEKDRYRCRVCGRKWEKRAPQGEGKRPSLVRLE